MKDGIMVLLKRSYKSSLRHKADQLFSFFQEISEDLRTPRFSVKFNWLKAGWVFITVAPYRDHSMRVGCYNCGNSPRHQREHSPSFVKMINFSVQKMPLNIILDPGFLRKVLCFVQSFLSELPFLFSIKFWIPMNFHAYLLCTLSLSPFPSSTLHP